MIKKSTNQKQKKITVHTEKKDINASSNIEYNEIVKIKKILKSDPKILWNYLQKKDNSKVQK